MRSRWLDPAPPPDEGTPRAPLLRRLGWFIAIALASGTAVAAVAYLLRGLLLLGY